MKVKNSYIGGMNQDLSKASDRSKLYYSLTDGRILTSGGLSTGAVENVKGTVSILDLANETITTGSVDSNDLKIIGKANIRDITILFTTTSDAAAPTATDGQIWRVDYNYSVDYTNAGFATATLLYEDDELNFSSYWPIKALGRYEADTLRRVYWVDHYNLLRVINIDDTTVTNAPSPADSGHVDPDYFDQVRTGVFPEIEIDQVIDGGNITAGAIQ